MSKQYVYLSALAPYMNELIKIKESCGQHVLHYKYILEEIDSFYCKNGFDQPVITSDILEMWRKTRINDKPSTLNHKYSVWIALARYISRQGIACFIPRSPRSPNYKIEFIPYIFTSEQINDIFEKSHNLRILHRSAKNGIMYIPAALRLIYSTGLRISEAMSIRNEDVKFDKNYILIRKTKNGAQRIVPINDSLRDVLLQYTTYRSKIPTQGLEHPKSWFFINTDGSACSHRAVTWWFRILLEQCGIPYLGDKHGPRIHDLRHTFAVHSLVQMVRAGIDLYASLPIISACLGHKSISATEKYVRLTSEMYPYLISQCLENSFVYPQTFISYEH